MHVRLDSKFLFQAQELTGVSVPKYYNPAAVNPLKYAEQVQKRKLLWSKKETKEVGRISIIQTWIVCGDAIYDLKDLLLDWSNVIQRTGLARQRGARHV
jgi:hypothetical protein